MTYSKQITVTTETFAKFYIFLQAAQIEVELSIYALLLSLSRLAIYKELSSNSKIRMKEPLINPFTLLQMQKLINESFTGLKQQIQLSITLEIRTL
ncbi:hypothetical protein MAH1_36260 [Sessilibacter sp. MAH1]